MSSTQKEEHGVKSSPWSTSDLAMGVPIKKRRFLFTRSPSPPSQSTAFPADDGKRQSSEITFPIQESCFSQVSGQHHDMGGSDLRDSSLALMAEHSTERENLAKDCGSSHSFSGLKFTLGTNTINEILKGENVISENMSALRPILGPISEKNEVGLKLGGGSSGSKLSSNDKSALQSVLANGGFPFPLNLQNEPPLGESIASSIQQESGHCELELALPERQFNTPSEQGSKFGASLVRQHSSRSHWNLNTTMDTWEGSTVDTTLNRGPVANEDPDLGNGNLNVSEMDSVEKTCQESDSALAISWNCGVSGGASSSKLSNTLNLPGETCAVNTDLNLHLNPASGSTSYSKVGVSFSPAILAARKADDLSLSTDFTSLTHGSNLAACGAGSAGKTEPVDGDGDKNSEFMKADNLESASVRDIKLEVSEAVEQESAKTASLSASGTVCGVAIKLEQLEVPTPDGLSLPQGSSHSLDSPRTLNKEVLPPVANGGGVVGCKSMHQSPLLPNVDAATVPAAKASVPDDTELTVVVEQESAKAESLSASGAVCGVGIKLEQLEVPTPDGLSLPQGSSHSLGSLGTLNKEVMPPVANDGGVVGCKSMHQSPLPPNVDAATVSATKASVPDDTELMVVVEQESARAESLSASGAVCAVGIKLEQLEVPTPDGLSLPQGSLHSLDSLGTLNKEVMPPVANDGGVVDCKNVHESPVPPNFDASQVMRETFTDSETVSAAKALVPDDTEIDAGQDMPFNADPPHHPGPSISRSPDNTSRHVVSDANESQSIDFPSIRALQEDVKGNANKISELSSEPTPTEENEIGPLKGAEVVDDSKDEEEEVSNAMAEICEQVSHSDDCTGPSGCISVDVTTWDKSTKNGLINAESKPEVKKFEMSEIRNEPLDSHDAVLVKEAVSKLHTDNDDYEDGEFRESLLRGATRVSYTINEKRTVDFKPSILVGNESTPEKPEELKDVHCTTESGPHPFPVNNATDSNVSEDVKESSAGHVMAAEPKKRKAMKITRRMPQGLGKKDPETNLALKKINNMSCMKGPGDIIEDLGAQLVKESVDQSSQLKAGVPQNDGADKHASNEECLSRMPRFGKDRDLDQAMQKARSDGLRMRGRISHPLGSPRGGWDTDRGCPSEHFSMPTSCLISGHKRAVEPGFAISTDDIYDSPGRIGRRHMDDDEDDDDDDELKNLTMRDLGPDRRSGGAAGGVSRGFSHHPWRPPRRSPEVFDTRPSLMHHRSPDDMPSRRHISPHFSGLHVPMVDMPRFDFELGSNRRMNPDYAGNFHQPLGDELCPEERRSSDDQPFGRRQQFTGGDDGAGHSRSFIPGAIRLHHESGEEFTRRAAPMRGGGDLRNRLRNVRRLAGVEEQEGDYDRGSGQGWHSGRLGDARLKRRRF
ncbi:unnamed protein product [Spirodela intermedia]|uniref:Uncharacterized protein n=1 Tax=Spirodela intermedia TaxID=51605 RepID=A0A7I8KK61_SPIIN|nr:unnamed protein product [Spirodela intermedia]